MAISREDVRHIAKLARLKLTSEEEALFSQQLRSILKYAENLKSLDTEEVEPTSHPLLTSLAFREDEVIPFKNTSEILHRAPQAEQGFFKVPKILL